MKRSHLNTIVVSKRRIPCPFQRPDAPLLPQGGRPASTEADANSKLSPCPRLFATALLPAFPDAGVNPHGQTPDPSVPPVQFQVLIHSHLCVLFNFPSQYFFAIGLRMIFRLAWSLPRNLDSTHKEPDSVGRGDLGTLRWLRGSHPLWRTVPGDFTSLTPHQPRLGEHRSEN